MEARTVIVVACFAATLTAYVERVGFSIAFTAMAKAAGLDEVVKGGVLSAFFWGYSVSQIPGGWAAQRYGGRRTLLVSFAAWSLASLLTPGSAARVGRVSAARVCVGVAQGGLIPAVHTVLSQWVPPHERARAVSLTTSGMYLGSALAMLLLPSLAAALGPASLLRIVGLLGLTWLVAWIIVGREPPRRRVSMDGAMPVTLADAAGSGDGKLPAASGGAAGTSFVAARAPWGALLSSTAVWAIVVNNFAFHYAFYVVMNWLPTYFTSVLSVDLASAGVAKALPYLAMFAASNAGGWLGDALILRRRFAVATARKTVNSVGMASAAVALMLMPAARGLVAGLTAVTLVMATLGLSRGGFSVNHMDIAPRHAGIVMGISNTAGTLAGVVGVAATGYVLDAAGGASSILGWWRAHALASSVLLAAATVFSGYARGTRMFD